MKTVSLVRFALVASVAGTCSALFAGQEALAASIQQARSDTIRTHNELVANIKALNALVEQQEGDLRPAFNAFQESLKGTRAASDRTLQQVEALQNEGEKHFSTWQAEIETINDEGIRSRAMKRLVAARDNWNAAAAALQQAAGQFPALLRYLSDIEKALSYDLTGEGVKSVRSTARSANSTFGVIQQATEKAVAELDELAASMSSVIKN